MKILVTGGAGYLGSVLVSMLLARGERVTVVDICMFGGEALLAHINNPLFRLEVGDIRDQRFIRTVFSRPFDAVVHLAALVGEPACKIDTRLTKQINTDSALRLATEAKNRGVRRFVYTSTCSNYGVSSPDALADEDSPLHPLSLYAETKVAAEKGLLALSVASFGVTILRLATLFGLSPKMRFNLLINEMVRDAWHGREIILYKEEAWRPYCHTSDAARAIAALLDTDPKKVSGEVFNVGTDNLQKKTLAALVKKQIPSIRVKREGGQPDNRDYRVSFAKAKKQIGFVPTKSIEEGIAETVLALKNKVWSSPYDPKYTDWLRKEFFA
ncbi:NAD(P)-dependent oxidoreductase [Candidatus Gottesmanbacteria bacterium]|nr:NAD(P)-dependent oxidoreductase [Candidatus Gottesmanbacteria bacterium]